MKNIICDLYKKDEKIEVQIKKAYVQIIKACTENKVNSDLLQLLLKARTLGLYIAHARHNAGKTQFQVQTALGIGDPRTIGTWENNGRYIDKHCQLPKPENIHLLAKFLNVSYVEEMYWLGLAGYISPTRMPPKEKTITVLDLFYKDMKNYKYPAYILDYRLNYWAVNPATVGLVGNFDHTVAMLRSFTSVLDIVFNSEAGLGKRILNIQDVQDEQIRRFIAKNLHRRHEPFWFLYPEYMQSRIPNDYHKFKDQWDKVTKAELIPGKIEDYIARLMYGYVTIQVDDNTKINFQLMAENVTYFLGNTFEIVRYVPVSDEDKRNADNFFSKYSAVDTEKLKLWKLNDIDLLLKEFEG